MTAQELIDRLNEVNDKSKPIYVDNIWEDWLLQEIEENDVEEHDKYITIKIDTP